AELAVRIVGIDAAALRRFRGGDEAVHSPAVDVRSGFGTSVRTAAVVVDVVGVRALTPPVLRIGYARGGFAVRHREPVGTRKGPEVAVERSVLLHDHDDMPDLVNSGERRAGGSHPEERDDAR